MFNMNQTINFLWLLSVLLAVQVVVAEEICVEGFIMDTFCINRGTLLDAPSIISLEEPERHSFHCLLDVSVCRASGYEILIPNPIGTTPKYRRGYKLDEAGNNLVIGVARMTGDKAKGCTTCIGSGMLRQGFRATVVGEVSENNNGPPLLTVKTLVASPKLFDANASEGCEKEEKATTTAVTKITPTTTKTSTSAEEICVEGFVMDTFCINRGRLLDAPSIISLEEPERHSFHCLLDVPVCRASGYEILIPNPIGTTPKYRRGYKLDEAGNNLVIQVARMTGDKAKGCTTCMGSGILTQGFRATVVGEVSENNNGPPLLTVKSLVASPKLFDANASNGCENGAKAITTSTMTTATTTKATTTTTETVKDMEPSISRLIIINWGFVFPTGIISAQYHVNKQQIINYLYIYISIRH